MRKQTFDRLCRILGEGDRRKIERATEVAMETLDNPAMIPDLIKCLSEENGTVVSHAAHAVMQIGAEDPSLFQNCVDELLAALRLHRAWEVGEQVPKVLCLLELTDQQADEAIETLVKQIDNRSAIAAACALSGLKRMTERGLYPATSMDRLIAAALKSPRKAVAARARQLTRQGDTRQE